MKNYLYSIMMLLISISITAQDFQGKAFYTSKTTIDPNFGENLPPDRKKRIMERLKANMEKNYELVFDNATSLFYEQKQLDVSGGNGRFNFMSFMSPIQGTLHKQFASNTFTNRVELFGKFFLIKDTLPDRKWVLTGESKTIGKYKAYKATITREVPQEVFQFGRQSNREANDALKMRTVNITAWFTPQIPLGHGPGEYAGLPGLILELNADRTTLLCSKIVMNPKNLPEIEAPTKGTVVTQAEFEDIVTKKTQEMRENWRNRAGRRGRWK
ncbi:MAG: GLPGLI family protein [Flavobacteriaceae bacterium]